jgi:photosystem II stability/assembly factor-like uncharacterized protein
MRTGAALILFIVLALPAAASAHDRPLRWKPVPTGSDQQYRGLDAVSTRVAWVGGSAGEVLRTTDGGRTWKDVSPPDSAGLLFRDVEASDERHASVLSIGEGDASRIYRTTDGGRSWRLAFVNDDPAAFYDCMDFFAGGRRGLALSDPVGGKFRIAATDDFGRTWHVQSSRGMPAAVEGEFAFAASGTCLVTSGGRDAWFGSGGGASRVFHSRDGGFTWKATAARSRRPRREASSRSPSATRAWARWSAATSRPRTTAPARPASPTTARPGGREATSPATARASTGSSAHARP